MHLIILAAVEVEREEEDVATCSACSGCFVASMFVYYRKENSVVDVKETLRQYTKCMIV